MFSAFLLSKEKLTGSVFVRFCIVGLFNTAFDAMVFLLLSSFWGLHKSRITSYVMALAFSYIGNKVWTFDDGKEMKNLMQFAKFFVVNMFTLSISIIALHVLLTQVGLEKSLAYFVTVPLTTILNFYGNRLWTFRINDSAR